MSRRTAFIRNNGRTEDGVPSFTTLYSRCVHLGCPVQPNGPIDEEATKEVNGVELRPVLAASFGCPCHGGLYDSEGNRTAGPPVRSLDRYEFSIVNGNLVLGRLFSVGNVEGTGAKARIAKYYQAYPGVHVDGLEQFLYPIPTAGVDELMAEVRPPAAARDRRPLPARLGRGALGPRRLHEVVPLPEGAARHQLDADARRGVADRVHRPGGHRRLPRDVLQARPRQRLRVDPNITEDVTLGWLVRGMHKWGASVFIILMFFHMARTFLFGAYKYPRELNWIIGVLILVLGMLEGFTGYLLPWDQTAYWATVVGINLNATAPFAGPFLAQFLQGGLDIGPDTLSKFYALHMLLIPGAIMALIGLHLYLVVRLGVTSPPWSKTAAGRERARGRRGAREGLIRDPRAPRRPPRVRRAPDGRRR